MSEPVDICKNCDHFIDEDGSNWIHCDLRSVTIADSESYSCGNFYSDDLEVYGPEEKEGPIWIQVDGQKKQPLDVCHNCDHYGEKGTGEDLGWQHCKLRKQIIESTEFASCVNFSLKDFDIFGPEEIDGPIWIDVTDEGFPSIPYPKENFHGERYPIHDWNGYRTLTNAGWWSGKVKERFLELQVQEYEKDKNKIITRDYFNGNTSRQMLIKTILLAAENDSKQLWYTPSDNSFSIEYQKGEEREFFGGESIDEFGYYKDAVFLAKLLAKMNPYNVDDRHGEFKLKLGDDGEEIQVKMSTTPSQYGEILEFEIDQVNSVNDKD